MRRLAWVLGYCLTPLAFVAASALFLNGCTNRQRLTQVEVWDDMKRQPKYLPQGASEIFADGRATRRPVAGTIARGHLKYDDVYHTGMVDAETYIGKNPEKIDGDLLKLGRSRFNTYCSRATTEPVLGRELSPSRRPPGSRPTYRTTASRRWPMAKSSP